MKEISTNQPSPLESTSTSPPEAELEEAKQFITDLLAFNSEDFLIDQTDAYFKAKANEDPQRLADLLRGLANSGDSEFIECATDGVVNLYSADAEIGRQVWEWMVTNEATYGDAVNTLNECMAPDPDRPFTRREIADYAAIRRRGEEYHKSRLQQE
ncbi:hypothetical protein ACIBCN_19930 [Nocardia sp. NPDC051052]|uniref:hypothetical protein n=1 Tax=Nocardia sp. NPDC051052 TaxID=3364322 RepID=UPI0037A30890